MQARNEIELDFSTNPDLAAIFAHKKVGQKCSLTIRLQVKSINEKQVTGSVEKVTSEYDEEKEAEPTPENPLAISMKPTLEYAD